MQNRKLNFPPSNFNNITPSKHQILRVYTILQGFSFSQYELWNSVDINAGVHKFSKNLEATSEF
jgi:hypothetical protein